MSKSTKPSQPIRLPQQTKEEQEMQMARFLSNKKEAFFQLILANLLQNPNTIKETRVTVSGKEEITRHKFNIADLVDAAIEGADYAITKLYLVEKKED